MPRQHELSKQKFPRRSTLSPRYKTKQAAKSLARLSTCLALTFFSSASGVSAQRSTTTPFTDQATGIDFQRFFGARTNFGFGIALPATPPAAGAAESFIGQLTSPLANGAGWGGFSLTGDMEGPLLMAAWPDGQGNIVSSFRQAFNEDDNPPEVTGPFALKRIPEATSVNNTFLTYTFLCEGCLAPNLGFGGAGVQATEMGWALASRAVRNPGSSNGVLGFHNSGFGGFSANIAAARNVRFNEWAALAEGQAVPASAGARAFDETNAAEGNGDDSGGRGGFDSDDDSGDDSDSDFD
ncbi:CBD9-like protein [Rhypophila decipiens]